MRFTLVILAALFCLNARAEAAQAANDDDIVAAAEKMVNEDKAQSATPAAVKTDPAPTAAAATTTLAATDKDATDETKIPVFTKSEKVVKSQTSLLWRLLGSLAFVGLIGGALIFASRRWKSDRARGAEKTRIEMLHQFHLGPKKSVALIRVAGEAILIGCTDHSVNFIKSIALIDDELENVLGGKDFNGFLDDEFTVEDMRTALRSQT